MDFSSFVQEWLAQAPAAQFRKLARSLEQQAVESSTLRFPEGAGVLQGASRLVEYINAPGRLLASRYLVPGGVLETFCVQTEGNQLKLGQRLMSPPADKASAQGTWWEVSGQLLDKANPSKPLPSFTQLAIAWAGATDVQPPQDVMQAYAEQALELQAVQAQLNEAEQALAAAQHRIQALEQQPPGSGERPAQDSTSGLPKDLRALAGWASQHEARMAILSRAINGAKKSRYRDPPQVFKGLEFLAGPYWEYRMGRLGKSEMENALALSGMQLAGAAGESTAGEQGDAYFVPWEGRRRRLDLHLLKGGGRDERFCLRIYFFWDAPTSKVVVGWLPSHLDNSLT